MASRLLELVRQRRTRGLTLAQAVNDLAGREGADRSRLRHEVRRKLKHLEESGQVILGRGKRYFAPKYTKLRTGRLRIERSGFGRLEASGDAPVTIPRSGLHGALDGDEVLVRLEPHGKRGRGDDSPEGVVVRILDRSRKTIVGRWTQRGGEVIVRPLERAFPGVIVPVGSKVGEPPREGEFVVVALDQAPGKRGRIRGTIIEHLGVLGEPGVENRVVLRAEEIPVEFSSEVEREARELPETISERDLAGRWDLRDRPAITIDGKTARDFDDAVSALRGRNGEIVVDVHIADVSHYVRPGSALDAAAVERGTSVYLPGLCVPMLPPRLSNDLCSLREDVDRLTMTVRFGVGPDGRVRGWEVHDSVIRSRRRCTYSEVFAWIEQPPDSWPEKTKSFAASLQLLAEAAERLAKRRRERGSLDFDLIEPDVLLDPEGRVIGIKPLQRNTAHRLIEELMVAANECVARTLMEAGEPTLYRVHDGPNPDKLRELEAILTDIGLTLDAEEDGRVPPSSLQKVLDEVAGTRWERFLSSLVLRTLARAIYSPEPRGHYALATESYLHFTSPIRRYPDLVVHRSLRALWRRTGRQEETRADDRMTPLALACTAAEQRADQAERTVLQWKKVLFMRDRVGEEMEAHITGVTDFGVFVQLDELLVEGLVHISELVDDFYDFDEARHVLTGRRTNRTWRLGDPLTVRVARVDLDAMRIDFTPVGLKPDLAVVRHPRGGPKRKPVR
ncbi:MAG: ribonuclease R [Acidobacteria bacterium]|nr:ribonuclease R [Acidobacteriota bacterium]